MKTIISGIMELNLPNKLTLLRIVLVPVYLVLLGVGLDVPALLVFIGRYFTRAPRLRSVFTLLKTTVLHPQPGQLFDGTLLSLGLAKTDFLVIALGLIVLLVLESLQERGVQIRAGLEKKSGFVQWAAMTALLLAVLLLGVFRAGYIPSGFIYTQF